MAAEESKKTSNRRRSITKSKFSLKRPLPPHHPHYSPPPESSTGTPPPPPPESSHPILGTMTHIPPPSHPPARYYKGFYNWESKKWSQEESGVKKITKQILNYKEELEILYLENNRITEIPSEINVLTNLRILGLENNMINQFPNNFNGLQNLKVLNLSHNPLGVIPNCIFDLVNLEALHLDNTNISNLPEEIENLEKLEFINISNNFFETIPDVFFKLKSINTIKMLRNPIKSKRELVKLIPLIDPKKKRIKEFYISLQLKTPDNKLQTQDFKVQIKKEQMYEDDWPYYYKIASFEQFVKELKELQKTIRNKRIASLRNSIIERGFFGIGPRAEGLIMNYDVGPVNKNSSPSSKKGGFNTKKRIINKTKNNKTRRNNKTS